MTFLSFLGWSVAAVVVLWVLIRVGSTAYFLSRQQYEERKPK
jgi:hypothetical protein